MEASRCAYKRTTVLNCVRQHNYFITQGNSIGYRTLVRPVVTCGSESWTLTVEEERALAVFERKILGKIYGAVKEKK